MKANGSVGSFLLGRVVAKGGSATVYEAIQRDLGRRRVAVKMLQEEKSAEPEQREMFRAQAEVMGRLSHPNISPVFEMGVDGDKLYYAMAFVEGRSLGDVLAEGRLDVERALRIIRQLGLALRYAHRKGFYHRNLSPRCVIISADGHVTLTGFRMRVPEGLIVGTPGYMSPEQIEGRPLDYTTDIYSLGVLVYEMLSGRNPFVAEGMVSAEVLERQLSDTFASIRDYGLGFDKSLDDALKKAIVRKSERYNDVSDFLNDLERSLNPKAPVLFEKTEMIQRPRLADLSRVVFTHYLSLNFTPVEGSLQIVERRLEMGLATFNLKRPEDKYGADFNVYWHFTHEGKNYLIISEPGWKMDDWRMQTRILVRVLDASTLETLTPEEVRSLKEPCIDACNYAWVTPAELEAAFGSLLERKKALPQLTEADMPVTGELHFAGEQSRVPPDLWVFMTEYRPETATLKLLHPVNASAMECAILRFFIGHDGQYAVLGLPTAQAVVVKVLDRTVLRTLSLNEIEAALRDLQADRKARPVWPVEEAGLVLLPAAGEKQQEFPPKIKIIKCFQCARPLRHTDPTCPSCGVDRKAPLCPSCRKPVTEWARMEGLSQLDTYVWNSRWEGVCCHCGHEFKIELKTFPQGFAFEPKVDDACDVVEVRVGEQVAVPLPDYWEITPVLEIRVKRGRPGIEPVEEKLSLTVDEVKTLIEQLNGPLQTLLQMKQWNRDTS